MQRSVYVHTGRSHSSGNGSSVYKCKLSSKNAVKVDETPSGRQSVTALLGAGICLFYFCLINVVPFDWLSCADGCSLLLLLLLTVVDRLFILQCSFYWLLHNCTSWGACNGGGGCGDQTMTKVNRQIGQLKCSYTVRQVETAWWCTWYSWPVVLAAEDKGKRNLNSLRYVT